MARISAHVQTVASSSRERVAAMASQAALARCATSAALPRTPALVSSASSPRCLSECFDRFLGRILSFVLGSGALADTFPSRNSISRLLTTLTRPRSAWADASVSTSTRAWSTARRTTTTPSTKNRAHAAPPRTHTHTQRLYAGSRRPTHTHDTDATQHMRLCGCIHVHELVMYHPRAEDHKHPPSDPTTCVLTTPLASYYHSHLDDDDDTHTHTSIARDHAQPPQSTRRTPPTMLPTPRPFRGWGSRPPGGSRHSKMPCAVV